MSLNVVSAYQQHASEHLKYSFDFSPRLAVGETITSQVVTVSPSGPTTADSKSGGIVTVMVSGGTVGVTYNLQVRAVTSAGQEIQLYASIFIIAD